MNTTKKLTCLTHIPNKNRQTPIRRLNKKIVFMFSCNNSKRKNKTGSPSPLMRQPTLLISNKLRQKHQSHSPKERDRTLYKSEIVLLIRLVAISSRCKELSCRESANSPFQKNSQKRKNLSKKDKKKLQEDNS